MTAISNHRLRTLTVALGVTVAVFVAAHPVAAYAAWYDLGSLAFGAVLDIELSLLVGITSLLSNLLSAVGNGLVFVLSLKITELTVVNNAWAIIRDMCNLVFIVVFIGISFGTIFNAIGWILPGWHYRQALTSLLIGALLINFSLAIGKTVVFASNAAMTVVLNVVKDPGAALVQQLQPNNLAIKTTAQLNAAAALKGPIVDTTRALTEAEQQRFQECLNEYKVVEDDPGFLYLKSLGKYVLNSLTFGATGVVTKVRKSVGDCNLEINDARYGTTPKQVAAQASGQILPQAPTGTIQQKLMLIGDAIFKILMIIVFISCLLSAAVFLGFRIIVVWVLLATSALAWASYAVPNQRDGWKLWWKHMIAWNVFGPLYILTLIPGLVILGGSTEVLQRLQTAGTSVGGANAVFQQLLFYAFSALIFIGGLRLSLTSSYAGSVKSTEIVGGWAGKMGAFQTGADKLGAVGRYTGVSPNVQALGERARQFGGDVTAGLRGRAPTIFGTDEQALAAARQRFGVRGGAAEFEKAAAGEINKERENLEASIKLRQAQAAARGKSFDDTAFLQSQAKSQNRNIALAASELLMSKGKLDAAGMKRAASEYGRVSPIARQGYIERVSKQLNEKAEKKEFSNSAEVIASMDILTQSQQDKLKKSLERNQPLVAGEMVAAGLYPGKTAASIVDANFDSLSNDNVLALLDKPATWKSATTERLIGGRMKKLSNYMNMINNGSPAQQAELQRILVAQGIRPRP